MDVFGTRRSRVEEYPFEGWKFTEVSKKLSFESWQKQGSNWSVSPLFFSQKCEKEWNIIFCSTESQFEGLLIVKALLSLKQSSNIMASTDQKVFSLGQKVFSLGQKVFSLGQKVFSQTESVLPRAESFLPRAESFLPRSKSFYFWSVTSIFVRG